MSWYRYSFGDKPNAEHRWPGSGVWTFAVLFPSCWAATSWPCPLAWAHHCDASHRPPPYSKHMMWKHDLKPCGYTWRVLLAMMKFLKLPLLFSPRVPFQWIDFRFKFLFLKPTNANSWILPSALPAEIFGSSDFLFDNYATRRWPFQCQSMPRPFQCQCAWCSVVVIRWLIISDYNFKILPDHLRRKNKIIKDIFFSVSNVLQSLLSFT